MEYCMRAFYNHYDSKEERFYLNSEDAECIINDYKTLGEASGNMQLASKKVESGDLVTWKMLEPFTIGRFCDKYFKLARNYADIRLRDSNTDRSGRREKVKSIINKYTGWEV